MGNATKDVGRTRIFIVDDHRLIREALANLIHKDAELELAGEAGGAEEALATIGRSGPDVALLDVRLPDGNGIELCREIRSRFQDVRCVIFTGAEDSMTDAVLAGASGYITKGLAGREVLESIKKVARGESILERGEHAAQSRRTLELAAKGLTRQEGRVLDLIGRGLTNREIAEDMHLAEQTVKNYVSALLAKLGLQRRTQAAVYASKIAPGGTARSRSES